MSLITRPEILLQKAVVEVGEKVFKTQYMMFAKNPWDRVLRRGVDTFERT